MGHTVWTRLRGQAETALSQRFDLKDFHDAGLNQGAVPLTVVEGVINDWIANRIA